MLSAVKDERSGSFKDFTWARSGILKETKSKFINDLKEALYASKIVSYAQGYALMKAAAEEYGWKLNYGGIALMWSGGCIIRSAFLGKIKEAFDNNPSITNLLLDPFFKDKIEKAQSGWRNVVSAAAMNGIPVPAISSALGLLSMVIGVKSYRLIFYRPSVIISEHILMKGPINQEVNFSIRTGQDSGGTTSSSTYNA